MSIDLYRHVCFKDLLPYIRKDLILQSLSEVDPQELRDALNITSDATNLIISTYDEVLELCQEKKLRLSTRYVITDFRSIYLDQDGKVLGLDDFYPSKEYAIVLTPISYSEFDTRVSLMDEDGALPWQVEYEFTPKLLTDKVSDKGRITFLKDENNNYAYYDFKNVKFKRSFSTLERGRDSYSQGGYFYTFASKFEDNSTRCYNNHLEKGAFNNVFLKDTLNTTVEADSHSNTIFGICHNNTFTYGFSNNLVIDNIDQCKGAVHGATIDHIPDGLKTLTDLNGQQYMSYLDPVTLTQLLIQL